MNPTPNYKRTKLACYIAYFTMSSIFCIPPLLFVTLRDMYGISYTLLGTLVLTNFCTQLGVDLIFTFFSKHFNIKKIVQTMPLITSVGLIVYALVPTFFPRAAYFGLLAGTVIFSLSAGLSEALLSPIIAAIPSENPQKDMSLLHSLYAFGVLTMVSIGTLFIKLFGAENWMYLMLFLALLPIAAAVLFMLSPIPDANGHGTSDRAEGSKWLTVGLALCVFCIFFGSCAENAMSNWISGYLENALHLDKTLGDILGVAMFAVLLGIARITYARFGKRIFPILMGGMVGASLCYLVVGLAPGATLSLIACVLTGLFTSMLWPGTLIYMEENIPHAGVSAFAMMAAGGDLGASVAPQLLGIVVDNVAASSAAQELAVATGLSVEQIGLKAGMLVIMGFPLLGILFLAITHRYFKVKRKQSHHSV